MEPKVNTSAGLETATQTSNRIKAAMAAASKEGGASSGGGQSAPASNPIADLLAERLEQQAKGISTSSASNLQASIESAISGTQRAGQLSSEALQIERQREVAFAQDRSSAQFTGAMEGRTGYATQVQALKELTETTEKSVRDLDQRYREAIMQNDAATAQRVADLQVQKLEFLQTQEQNFYSNLLGVANLQQEALSMAQQNDQFIRAQAQQDAQFQDGLAQSKYQFEQNYGLDLQRIGLDEQQLELQRQRNNISMAEFQLRKSQLNQEKATTKLEAIVSQDIRNQMAAAGDDATLDLFKSPSYMAQVRQNTGFEGSAEELAEVVDRAWNVVSSDESLRTDLQDTTVIREGGLVNSPIVSGVGTFFGGTGRGLTEMIMGVPQGQQSMIDQAIANLRR